MNSCGANPAKYGATRPPCRRGFKTEMSLTSLATYFSASSPARMRGSVEAENCFSLTIIVAAMSSTDGYDNSLASPIVAVKRALLGDFGTRVGFNKLGFGRGGYPNRAIRDTASSRCRRIAAMQGEKLPEKRSQSLTMAKNLSAKCSAARQVSPSTEADSGAGESVSTIAPPLFGANPMGSTS